MLRFMVQPPRGFEHPFPSRQRSNGYIGIAALVLALIAVLTRWAERWVRIFTALALLALAFAMGSYNLFHGILYALAPLF